MLVEVVVRNLGVIDELRLVLGPGMTALTGETGAGKTLVVEAIELLMGGRPDPVMVRPGADEAWVEGRFETPGGEEVVLARAVPASGRSRAYVDGRMVPVSTLSAVGADLVDLHGQHDHQSLLSGAVQRAALDAYGRVDRSGLDGARAEVASLESTLGSMGGDARARARELDVLRYQRDELVAAGLDDPLEEAALEAAEAVLADASSWREAATLAHAALDGDGGAGEALSTAVAALRGRSGAGPFAEVADRLAAAAAEVSDVAREVLGAGEAIADDPERLAALGERRHLLRELRRKYGDTLADVIAYRATVSGQVAALEGFEERAAELEQSLAAARERVGAEAAVVAAARAGAAPSLAAAVEGHLRDLALPHARFDVSVGGAPPSDDVVFGLGANPGEPVLPLAKVASGGELARTMLAARLVLTAGPPTLVFDEVDAGIGGEAATAVGRALAALGASHQVLVVTHLPQVAAFADAQIAVTKLIEGSRTVARVAPVVGPERVVELSRMLSGSPSSSSARQHAEELLAVAAGERGRPVPGAG